MIQADFNLGALTARFHSHPKTKITSFELLPTKALPSVVSNREYIDGVERDVINPQWQSVSGLDLNSCVQVKLRGDNGPRAFAQGRTMRNSSTTKSLQLVAQYSEQDGPTTWITTQLISKEQGIEVDFILEWREGAAFVTGWTELRNIGNKPVTVEMLSSFCLDNITPFQPGTAPEQLYLHRFRSAWAMEGRHERLSLEQLQLERSWVGYAIFSERFGQVGSMPVRGFFPFAALEDSEAGVFWGAQLAVPGSWQMECYRRSDNVSLSGGLADREFGHWWKTLESGESISSPRATLSSVVGDIDDLCAVMLEAQNLQAQPIEIEKDLPIIFNEWCSTWGNPNHDNILATAEKLAETKTRYLVIDDGWAERPGHTFQQNGDWIINKKAFPLGLKATCQAVREKGLIPGIWFEFEVCNPGSKAFEETMHQLKRDGAILNIGLRRFWDFRDPWVVHYLTEKVIDLIRDNNFGYLKVDYNETLGIGCDELGDSSPGSPGEGLRQHLEAVQTFFRKIRAELPELVIEVCASGGHRLEPSFLEIASLGSFSDAHETVEIPIIGANLQRMMLPRQNQVWAVLQTTDSISRIRYSLSANFLGRMCISGNLHELSEAQLNELKKAQELYVEVTPIIAEGKSRILRGLSSSWRNPKGWQVVLREGQGAATGQLLIVLHGFAEVPEIIEFTLPRGKWSLAKSFNPPPNWEQHERGLTIKGYPDYHGSVFLFKQVE